MLTSLKRSLPITMIEACLWWARSLSYKNTNSMVLVSFLPVAVFAVCRRLSSRCSDLSCRHLLWKSRLARGHHVSRKQVVSHTALPSKWILAVNHWDLMRSFLNLSTRRIGEKISIHSITYSQQRFLETSSQCQDPYLLVKSCEIWLGRRIPSVLKDFSGFVRFKFNLS